MASVQIQPHGNENATMGVSALAIALAVVSVALRFYTRVFTRAGLKADDWLILSAVVATLLTAVLLLWAGLWVSENTDPNYVYTPEDIFYLKLAFVTSVLYFTISGATKLGITFMYHRIFAVSTAFHYLTFIAGGLVMGWWVGCTVATLTNCIPLEWSWMNSLADPRYCFNYNIFWMASGACEIFLDVLILSLPIMVVVRMRLSLQQKLTVSGIFLLGGLYVFEPPPSSVQCLQPISIIITGLVRVILGYPSGKRVPSYSNTEVWTSVHTGMSIVCSCLPILKPLLNRISGSRFITKVSSVLSLRHSEGSLRQSPSRILLGPSGDSGSGGNKNKGQMRISPLVTIGGTAMPDSYFYQQRVAYLGDDVNSTTRQERTPEMCREECEQGLFLQLPEIDISEDIRLSFLNSK
ncbi:hypothetical protein Hte_001832 [Hypoxylon texense]